MKDKLARYYIIIQILLFSYLVKSFPTILDPSVEPPESFEQFFARPLKYLDKSMIPEDIRNELFPLKSPKV